MLGLAARLSSHANGIDLQRCTVSNKTTKNRAKCPNTPHFYSTLCYNKSNTAMLNELSDNNLRNILWMLVKLSTLMVRSILQFMIMTQMISILGASNVCFLNIQRVIACDSIGDCFNVIFRPYNEVQPPVEPSVKTTDKPSVVEAPKHTIDDFVEAFGAEAYGVEYIMSSDEIARVTDYLEKKHNADYQLYLELKKRFEK